VIRDRASSALRIVASYLRAARLSSPNFVASSCLLLSFVSGCVNQHAEVMTYRKVVDSGLPRPKSYQPGQPLSLARAMALANEDNEQIALQGENYLQALIAKNRAVSNFLPTISFQPDYTIEQAPRNGTTPATAGVSPQVAATSGGFIVQGDTWQRLEAPVVGNMNLNFVSYPNLRSTEQTIVQQRQLLIDAQATILLEVAQTYYQILRSEQQVRVLENSLKLQQARLNDAQIRFENHLALALEVSQTRAQVASTEAELTQAQSDVRNGRHTLAFLIGVSEIDGSLIDEVAVPDQIFSVDDFRASASIHRQDLLAAEAAVRAAKYSVDAAIAQYYPSVSINVAGFLYREYFSQASKWDAILIANLPIFSAGIIEADVRQAWSRLRQAALYQAELRRQIDRDVQIAHDNLITSEKLLVSLKEEVQAASDALNQSQQLLHNQLAIPLDVLTAQDTLLTAQLNFTSENFSRAVFYLDLLRITGELTPDSPAHWHPGTTAHAATSPSTLPDGF
jgi:outer membrane protein TolC